MAPKIFDKFWSIILTNSYDIQLSLATSIICRLSHLNTHTTTDNNFQDISQRLASSSTHPCSKPRYINENAIFKRTSLLSSSVKRQLWGVTLGNLLYLFLSVWPSSREDVLNIQNNLSQIRALKITEQKCLAIFDLITWSKQTWPKGPKFRVIRKLFLLTLRLAEESGRK